jgi:hypothetical protein
MLINQLLVHVEDIGRRFRQKLSFFDVVVMCEKNSLCFMSEKELKSCWKPEIGGYSCGDCGDLFSKPPALIRHLDYCHSDHLVKQHRCTKCPKSFDLRINFHVHVKQEHSEVSENPSGGHKQRFHCKDCTKNYADKRGLRRHINNHHQKSKLIIHCRRSQEKIQKFKIECRKSCTGNTKFPKPVKSAKEKTFKSRTSCTEPKKRFNCEYCTKSYGAKKFLYCHRDRHHQRSKVKQYQCEFCPRSFGYKENFRIHLRHVHEMIEETNIICKFCLKPFAFSCNLSKHLKTSCSGHPGSSNVKRSNSSRRSTKTCSTSPDSFGSENELQSRNDFHHAKVQPETFKCLTCFEVFNNIRTLDGHVDRQHPTERRKNYDCKFCKLSFRYENNLRIHMRKIHRSSSRI